MFTSWGSWHVHKGEQTTEGDLGRHISTHSARALMLKRDEEQPRWGTQQTQRVDIFGHRNHLACDNHPSTMSTFVHLCTKYGYLGTILGRTTAVAKQQQHIATKHTCSPTTCIAWGSQQPNHLCALSTSHKVTKSIHHLHEFIVYP
jgi:hypothetical protein